MKRLKHWFNGLSLTGKVASLAVVSVLSIGTIGAPAQPDTSTNVAPSPAATQPSRPTPIIIIYKRTAAPVIANKILEDITIALLKLHLSLPKRNVADIEDENKVSERHKSS